MLFLCVATACRLEKDKQQTVEVAIHSPDEVNEELLYTTNKGALEFESIKIPLSGDIAEITGEFL